MYASSDYNPLVNTIHYYMSHGIHAAVLRNQSHGELKSQLNKKTLP